MMRSQTCRRCGSQAEPYVPRRATAARVCSACGWVYRAEPNSSQSPAEAEIRDAIAKIRSPASILNQNLSSGSALNPSAVAGELSLPSGRITKARKGPVLKTRSGHFQISIWKNRSSMASSPRMGTRICVQHSIWDELTCDWKNQSIWCPAYELRDLLQAVEDLLEIAPRKCIL